MYLAERTKDQEKTVIDSGLEEIGLSIITASKPARLSKAFKLNSNGLKKIPGGQLVKGAVREVFVRGPGELINILNSLQPNHALTFGTCQRGNVKIVTSEKFDKNPDNKEIAARCGDHFYFPSRPGIMMLDHDLPSGSDPVTREELLDRLSEVVPELKDTPGVICDSASTHIYNKDTGEKLKGDGGKRVYLFVKDASDISRAGQVLFNRLVLAGFGYIFITESGVMLKRTVVDGAVWQPERLDFAAGAYCYPPLEQRRPAPEELCSFPINDWLDTRKVFSDLTKDEQRKLDEIWRKLKEDKRGEAEKVKDKWSDKRVDAEEQKRVKEGKPKFTQEERHERRKKYRESLESCRLLPEQEIILKGGTVITVADILADPKRYHNQRCCDPLEPDYGDDDRIAVIFTDQSPKIVSHAHGQHTIDLIDPEKDCAGDGSGTAISPEDRDDIIEMVERLVYIQAGNSVADLSLPPQDSILKMEEAKNSFRNLPKVKVNGNYVLPITNWMGSTQRKTARGTGFRPKADRLYEENGSLWVNTFHMPDFQKTEARDKVTILKDHLALLAPDDVERSILLQWLAATVHQPDQRSGFTPLHISVQHGLGRGWFAELINCLVGHWNCSSVKMKVLAGQSNEGQYQNYLWRTLFCNIPEVKVGSGRFDIDDEVRDKLTDKRLSLNIKYGENGFYDIYTNFLMATNSRDALVLSKEDRRIFVVESNEPKPKSGYFEKKLYPALADKDFLAQSYYWLKEEQDPNHYVHQTAPMTRTKATMINLGSDDLEKTYNMMVDDDNVADIICYDIFKLYAKDEGLYWPDDDHGMRKKATAILRRRAMQVNAGNKMRIATGSYPVTVYAIRNTNKWLEANGDELRNEYKLTDTF